jgi:hypothetical protein
VQHITISHLRPSSCSGTHRTVLHFTSPHWVAPILVKRLPWPEALPFPTLHFRFLTLNPSVEQYSIREEIYLIATNLLRSIKLLCLFFLTSLCVHILFYILIAEDGIAPPEYIYLYILLFPLVCAWLLDLSFIMLFWPLLPYSTKAPSFLPVLSLLHCCSERCCLHNYSSCTYSHDSIATLNHYLGSKRPERL